MEVACVELLNPRLNSIVPNVYFGLGLRHECDLLMASRKMRFTEIEIKVTKADLAADFRKPHGHRSEFITRLVYAVTDEILEYAMDTIPNGFGIISVSTVPILSDGAVSGYYHRARWVRQVKHRPSTMKADAIEDTYRKFLQLGAMRIWTLKRQLHEAKSNKYYKNII